ncbi:MAG TPA: hypothetical protein VFS58_06480 [Steroidobacteraceae bacterium]|nr:hypothetical protein [Steroidobacteraceae bacterium]
MDVPNANRVGAHVREPNFGLIEIDWSGTSPTLVLQAITQTGKAAIRHPLKLSKISWRAS